MIKKVTVANTDEKNGISLTSNISTILQVAPGDTVYMIEHNNSVHLLTKKSPLYDQLKAGIDAINADEEVHRRLAK